MVDDRSHFKPLDPGRVNPRDELELKYWCKELRCSEAELLDALSKVGDHVAEVREALATRG